MWLRWDILCVFAVHLELLHLIYMLHYVFKCGFWVWHWPPQIRMWTTLYIWYIYIYTNLHLVSCLHACIYVVKGSSWTDTIKIRKAMEELYKAKVKELQEQARVQAEQIRCQGERLEEVTFYIRELVVENRKLKGEMLIMGEEFGSTGRHAINQRRPRSTNRPRSTTMYPRRLRMMSKMQKSIAIWMETTWPGS